VHHHGFGRHRIRDSGKADAVLAPNQNIENNPMQSRIGMVTLSDPAKTFDTSGKSPAYIHHRKI
jgi:hypothetical protein